MNYGKMANVPTELLSQYIKEILEESPSKYPGLLELEDEESPTEQIVQAQEPRSRGRPRIPLRWTRMISIFHDDLSKVKCYDLATDLMVDNAMDKTP